MLNIYVIVLTIIVLCVLEKLWKNINIEKFAETPSNSDLTSIQNLASIYNSDEAVFPKVKTTGDLEVGTTTAQKSLTVSGTSNLNDVTIASGKTLTIGGKTLEQIISSNSSTNFSGNLTTDLNVGTADAAKNLNVTGTSTLKNLTTNGVVNFNDNIIVANNKELKIGGASFIWDSQNNRLILKIGNTGFTWKQ